MISDEQRAWLRDTILANFGFECPDCPSTSTCAIETTDDSTKAVVTVSHQTTCPAPFAVCQGTITFAERRIGGTVNVEQGFLAPSVK